MEIKHTVKTSFRMDSTEVREVIAKHFSRKISKKIEIEDVVFNSVSGRPDSLGKSFNACVIISDEKIVDDIKKIPESYNHTSVKDWFNENENSIATRTRLGRALKILIKNGKGGDAISSLEKHHLTDIEHVGHMAWLTLKGMLYSERKIISNKQLQWKVN